MKKTIISSFLVCVIALNLASTALATDVDPNPGSQTYSVDFSKITRGLYYDGYDFYFLLDTGIVATNYMYNFDGDRFFFGEDGKMVKDQIIDYEGEKYYFDPNGAMIKSRWVTYEEVDPYDGTSQKTTYYFGPTGRAYRAADGTGVVIKTIDGERFGFNIDGERLEGYVSANGDVLDENSDYAYADCVYYFDPSEDCAATTGWHYYAGLMDEATYDSDSEMYLYFDEKTCRKVYSREEGKYIGRTIDGLRYLFDANGVRKIKWYGSATSSVAPKYFSEDYDGFLSKGWFQAIPQECSNRQENQKHHSAGEEQWYYADSTGKILRSTIKKIGHYTYAFDEDGVMQSDALVVTKEGSYVKSYNCDDITRAQVVLGASEGGILNDGETFMYFSDGDGNDTLDGAAPTQNKSVKVEVKDDEITFVSNGRGGYTNYPATSVLERNGKWFQHGVLLKPLNDYKFGVVRRDKTISTDNYFNPVLNRTDSEDIYYYGIVNNQGTIQTKYGCYKDNNGNYLLARADG